MQIARAQCNPIDDPVAIGVAIEGRSRCGSKCGLEYGMRKWCVRSSVDLSIHTKGSILMTKTGQCVS